LYSTLADVDPDGLTNTMCQNNYLTLPFSDWQLAPNDDYSRDVIMAHSWSTGLILVSDGKGYYVRTGGYYGNAKILNSGLAFAAAVCNAQILIRCVWIFTVLSCLQSKKTS
jgi:hypothetical protein